MQARRAAQSVELPVQSGAGHAAGTAATRLHDGRRDAEAVVAQQGTSDARGGHTERIGGQVHAKGHVHAVANAHVADSAANCSDINAHGGGGGGGSDCTHAGDARHNAIAAGDYGHVLVVHQNDAALVADVLQQTVVGWGEGEDLLLGLQVLVDARELLHLPLAIGQLHGNLDLVHVAGVVRHLAEHVGGLGESGEGRLQARHLIVQYGQTTLAQLLHKVEEEALAILDGNDELTEGLAYIVAQLAAVALDQPDEGQRLVDAALDAARPHLAALDGALQLLLGAHHEALNGRIAVLLVLVQGAALAHQLAAVIAHVAQHLVVYVANEVAAGRCVDIRRAATRGRGSNGRWERDDRVVGGQRTVAVLPQAVVAHELVALQAADRGAHLAPAAADARVVG